MLCPGCGRDIPFVGDVCPYCHRDKKAGQQYMVFGFIYGIGLATQEERCTEYLAPLFDSLWAPPSLITKAAWGRKPNLLRFKTIPIRHLK